MFCCAPGTMTGWCYRKTEEKEGLMWRRMEDKHCFMSVAITWSQCGGCGVCFFPGGVL